MIKLTFRLCSVDENMVYVIYMDLRDFLKFPTELKIMFTVKYFSYWNWEHDCCGNDGARTAA